MKSPNKEATKAGLIKLMESLYEGGWGGGPPSNDELAEALLKKYRILKR